MTGTFRVLLTMRVTPEHAGDFERVWADIAAAIAAEPACLGQELWRDAAEPDRYHVISDWADEETFRRFERGTAHVGHRHRLAPLRSEVTMTTMRPRRRHDSAGPVLSAPAAARRS